MDLASYYIKSGLKKYSYYLSILFYFISLFSVCISSPYYGVQERGYMLLFTGWIQTSLGISSLNLLASLPWLGNVFIFSSLILIYMDFGKRLCLISALISLICISAFFYRPVVMMGADLAMISVNINFGVYMWLGSGVFLVSSAFFVQDMPNKKKP